MYLFILCPPFSGSTILYKILNTSPNISTFLQKIVKVTLNDTLMDIYIHKGEGQFLYELYGDPEKKELYSLNRHKPGYSLPIDDMDSVWKQHWDHSKPILCEKSPPFVHFAEQIENYYGKDNVKFIIMIRNPYACRWNKNVPNWNVFAKKQKENLNNLNNTLLIRYEDLVSDPNVVKKRILNFVPELENINMYIGEIDGLSTVRGARNKEITTEFRDRVLDKELKNEYLNKNLLDFFGYKWEN